MDTFWLGLFGLGDYWANMACSGLGQYVTL